MKLPAACCGELHYSDRLLGNLGDGYGVDEGVQELRIDYGPGYRVYFG